MITDNTIQQLQDAVKTEVITVNDQEYATRVVFDPRKPDPQPKILALHSLTALVEYVRDVVDSDLEDDRVRFVHVEEPHLVSVCTRLYGDFKQRDVLAQATFASPGFPFGQFIDAENFVIALLSRFVGTTDRDRILRIVGNVQSQKNIHVEDDGVTQKVIVRKGISREAEAEVSPFVTLAPFRTFTEVDQPLSLFLLRLRAEYDEDQIPNCALFEADGGMWKNEARQSIKTWLASKLLSPEGDSMVSILA